MSGLAAALADSIKVGNFDLLYVLLAGVAGAAVLLVVMGLQGGADKPDEISMRLERYADPAQAGPPAAPRGNSPKEIFQAFSESLNQVMSRSARTGKLGDELQRADLKLKPSEWAMIVAGSGVLAGLLAVTRFGTVIAFLPCPPLAYLISGMVLKYLQGKRSRAFDRQLGDTIILLSNALKAGYSFSQAISTVGKTASPPIADEFNRATREMALGLSVDDALGHMVKRNQSDDFDLMVTAVQIHRVVGGNLAEILDTIATTIRERVRIKGEIRTLTAQARASGWIITILPIALAGILTVISPDYFKPMFSETLGRIMLLVGGFSMAVGFALIQKIVKIEV
jgi:tight adherence protein B